MRILKSLRAACLFLTFFSGTVLAQDLPTTVIEALGRAGIPGHAIGTYVQEVAEGPVLVAHNPHSAFNPASVMKLVTTDAALELLGPAFTWKTQAYVNGMQDGDVLHGDLVIRGGGDPKLTAEHLWSFLRRIRARGIRDIRGNLVLDRSAFEDIPYDPALFDGDPMRAYNAGPDALLLNYKALTFRFTPEEASGKVNFSIDPPIDGYAVAPPRLSNDECGDWRTKLMPMVDAEGARFDGALSMQCGERIWHVHPYQMTHAQYFGAVFRQLWTELGGKLKGDVRDGVVPPTAHLVAEWESASLSEVIRDINKYSNNVMARQLLLTIGHQALQLPATPERGAAIVRMWLANKGIDAPDLSIENGSGLSRNERISALTLGRLLGKVYQAPTMPEFISSMPLVGYDGTMRQRLNGYGVAGHAHIKTGTLNEVRAVAGYVLAASGKRYAVVSIVNHANASRAHEAQDALLQWVHEQG